jgi:hypothetical protein
MRVITELMINETFSVVGDEEETAEGMEFEDLEKMGHEVVSDPASSWTLRVQGDTVIVGSRNILAVRFHVVDEAASSDQ